jgi:hypothetical protein
MKPTGSIPRLWLQLPELSAFAASNHRMMQERLQFAFETLSRSDRTGDEAAVADVSYELMVSSGCWRTSATRSRRSRTLLADFAAAAPLFAQLLACDHLGPAQAGLGRRARWRGPLNRSR